MVAGGRGPRDALSARLVAKRPFAGYWEYYLDTALFTAPAHPHWGGAACIGPGGDLIGIGSLLVQEVAREGQSLVGNMVVPADLLPPILDDLLRFGRVDRPPRPWLGLFATDAADGVVVTGLRQGRPRRARRHRRGRPGDRHRRARRSRIWAISGASSGPRGRPGSRSS